MAGDIVEKVVSAKRASIPLSALGTDDKDRGLRAMAEALDRERSRILEANAQDVRDAEALMDRGELSGALVRRLQVTDAKIDGMIAGIRDVTSLPDPVGRTISALELDDGLELFQVSTPIGLVGVIFESRPDVVPQIMSLCLKSGNATVFKGGSEAARSNRALFDVLKGAIASEGLPADAFQLMETREDVGRILELDAHIDLLIPRGSNSFVRYIQDNTRIPVLGHASGICHVYVHGSADPKVAMDVVVDSKVQYPAVCNAVETLIVDAAVDDGMLVDIARGLVDEGVELRCDARSLQTLEGAGIETVAATGDDWDEEYNDLVLAVRVVDGIDEAIEHINEHGSHHTDAIVAEDRDAKERFVALVDSSSVMLNASTRFADGYRYGKGAEVGISTNKVHSRGPVGMEGLMIHKYILVGDGHVVKDYASGARGFTHRPIDREYGDRR